MNPATRTPVDLVSELQPLKRLVEMGVKSQGIREELAARLDIIFHLAITSTTPKGRARPDLGAACKCVDVAIKLFNLDRNKAINEPITPPDLMRFFGTTPAPTNGVHSQEH